MFSLPSMWNLVISTVVFFVAAWYFHRVLEDQGIPKGMTRGLLVFVLASIVSWMSGDAVDWVHDKIEGPPPATAKASGDDMKQLMKALSQAQQ
jgi:hypothetical protein